MPASYGGAFIFGLGGLTKIRHQPNLTASMISAFFGLTGNQSLAGGGRGRGFMIEGVFNAATPYLLVTTEQFFLTYADGIARPLVDTVGAIWPNVCFYGEYQRTGNPQQYIPAPDGSWLMPYKAIFQGLT
jgi:hypothetical protein